MAGVWEKQAAPAPREALGGGVIGKVIVTTVILGHRKNVKVWPVPYLIRQGRVCLMHCE